MTLEYMKYLVALGRESLRKLDRDAPAATPSAKEAAA